MHCALHPQPTQQWVGAASAYFLRGTEPGLCLPAWSSAREGSGESIPRGQRGEGGCVQVQSVCPQVATPVCWLAAVTRHRGAQGLTSTKVGTPHTHLQATPALLPGCAHDSESPFYCPLFVAPSSAFLSPMNLTLQALASRPFIGEWGNRRVSVVLLPGRGQAWCRHHGVG